MPRPSTPVEVDGVGLGLEATQFLGRLIDTIYAPDPMRPAADIETQAVSSFLKAYETIDGVWVARTAIQLGTSEADAVVINPAAIPF